jgi:hypothetical protein
MNKNTKIAIAVIGTGALVYLAYKMIPKVLGTAASSGCEGETCTGYSCKIIDDYYDRIFPPQSNLDDNGNPIFSNKCSYKRFRDNDEYMTSWANAIANRQDSFVATKFTTDISEEAGNVFCTTTGKNINDPNSGSMTGNIDGNQVLFCPRFS